MNFIQQFKENIIGTLSGFDRVRFRGTARRVSSVEGMGSYLAYLGIKLIDFGSWAQGITETIRQASRYVAEVAQRPIIYLQNAGASKEELAKDIARKDNIKSGLICIIEAVEPCYSFDIRGNHATKKKELVYRLRKCVHTYHYQIHPEFGFMHARVQTWFPFNIHICINGREWLSRQLDAAKIKYIKRENCFTRIADIDIAQSLCQQQLRTNWDRMLKGIAIQASPAYEKVFANYPLPHYWSADETEWATDIMFKDPNALQALYPTFLNYAMRTFDSREVMRFLGQKVPPSGGVYGQFLGEVVSDMRQRPEGIRIKHRVNSNSVKMYDKQGSVLRVETTISNTREFKVFRRPEKKPKQPQSWQKMRKGTADLHRRAKISQASNDRYLNALAAVKNNQKLATLLSPVCKRVAYKGGHVRGLNPLREDDRALLRAVARGEFVLNGFKNSDLRILLCPIPINDNIRRKQAAAITRSIRMLRAHGIIHKTKQAYRYKLSPFGASLITALNAACEANTKSLLELAA